MQPKAAVQCEETAHDMHTHTNQTGLQLDCQHDAGYVSIIVVWWYI